MNVFDAIVVILVLILLLVMLLKKLEWWDKALEEAETIYKIIKELFGGDKND